MGVSAVSSDTFTSSERASWADVERALLGSSDREKKSATFWLAKRTEKRSESRFALKKLRNPVACTHLCISVGRLLTSDLAALASLVLGVPGQRMASRALDEASTVPCCLKVVG
jgi:hypothetical protein